MSIEGGQSLYRPETQGPNPTYCDCGHPLTAHTAGRCTLCPCVRPAGPPALVHRSVGGSPLCGAQGRFGDGHSTLNAVNVTCARCQVIQKHTELPSTPTAPAGGTSRLQSGFQRIDARDAETTYYPCGTCGHARDRHAAQEGMCCYCSCMGWVAASTPVVSKPPEPPRIWPDEAEAARMLVDTEWVERFGVPRSPEDRLGRHVLALLARVRELEAERAGGAGWGGKEGTV